MDMQKIGSLIHQLRSEKKLTQKQLSERINVSDKAISKWERGQGCPDITLLPALSSVFGVDIIQLLQGELQTNDIYGGNMKQLSFYICHDCGNILTATGKAQISCCGRKLPPLLETKLPLDSQDEHIASFQMADGEYYVTLNHPMSKEHYIMLASYITYDKVFTVRLYPEQEPSFRMPEMHGGKFIVICSQHGLFSTLKAELNMIS